MAIASALAKVKAPHVSAKITAQRVITTWRHTALDAAGLTEAYPPTTNGGHSMNGFSTQVTAAPIGP